MKYEFSKETPGIFQFKQVEQIETFIETKINEISSNNNSRTIVLETWLIVDWFLRQLIISGIKCLELQNDNYNPHYELLPNSFRECLEILKELKSSQEKLEPSPPKLFSGIKGNFGIWKFIKKESIETYNKLNELENKYLRKFHKIESENFVILENTNDTNKYRFVSNEWLDSVVKIDEEWFKKVTILNKARNYAAHDYNENKIYDNFGINGLKKQELLREKCIELLSIIIGLIPNEK